MRDANPTVVLIPGIGMFSFGKNKTEARITGEFYTNAIHVMEGASALGSGADRRDVAAGRRRCEDRKLSAFSPITSRCRHPKHFASILAARRSENSPPAPGKRTQPPDLPDRRRRHGVGRETALLAAQRGAHVVVADRDLRRGKSVAARRKKLPARNPASQSPIDVRDRESIRSALREMIATFGGLDIIVNTAAIFPSSPDGEINDEQWADSGYQCHRQSSPDRGSFKIFAGTESNRERRAGQLGQCCRRETRQRSLRRKQSRGEPSRARIRDFARARKFA